jgi:hypothetical protein
MHFKRKLTSLLGITALAVATLSSQAQQIVYDNLSTAATAGYSEPNANNPIFGDALSLTTGGHLSILGLSIFNSTSGGNTGSILTGSMVVKFYDNSVPYGGGALSSQPLIATAVLTWDFTAGGGLAPGFYATEGFDLTALNINLPQNIFITQQFTETTGTSTRNGIVLFSNPVVGSSPANVYLNSAATPEGLYTFSGGNPNQFGYYLEVVPEPSTLAFAGLAGTMALILRRRKAA